MKLKTNKIIFVGLAFLIISMFWQTYDTIIAKMVINTFGFNQTWSGVILALDNVLALFLLPLFGVLSDRTKTKYGKRTPYIFFGVLVSALLFVGVAVVDNMQLKALEEANIPAIESVERTIDGEKKTFYIFDYEGASQKEFDTKEAAELARTDVVMAFTKQNNTYLILFIGILLLVLLTMATYRTPAVSLMPDVTPKPLRSKANAIINLMGSVGGVIALGLGIFLAKDYQSYIPLFAVTGGLMLVLLAVFMFTVNEPKLLKEMHEESVKYGIEEKEDANITEEKMPKDVRKSFLLIIASIVFWFIAYNAATSKISIYAQRILDMGYASILIIAQAAAIISFIPIGFIASKVGRKKTILVGIVILTVAFILGFIATSETKFLIYVTMALAGIGWATINVNSYPMIVEMSKGANIGKYTGYYYTASMSAQILTPVLSGFIMDQLGMRSLFPYSVVFCILALITMSQVKHGDSKPIPKEVVVDAD